LIYFCFKTADAVSSTAPLKPKSLNFSENATTDAETSTTKPTITEATTPKPSDLPDPKPSELPESATRKLSDLPDSGPSVPSILSLPDDVSDDVKSAPKVSPSRYDAIAVLDTEENEEEKWAGETFIHSFNVLRILVSFICTFYITSYVISCWVCIKYFHLNSIQLGSSSDRTSVITKWQHEEHKQYAGEFVEEIISEVVQKSPEDISEVVDKTLEALSEDVQMSPEAISQVSEKQPEAISEVIEMSPEATFEVDEKAPGQTFEVVEMSPAKASKVVETSPEAISEVIEKLPKSTSEVVDMSPEANSEIFETLPEDISEVLVQTAVAISELVEKSPADFPVAGEYRWVLFYRNSCFVFIYRHVTCSCLLSYDLFTISFNAQKRIKLNLNFIYIT